MRFLHLRFRISYSRSCEPIVPGVLFAVALGLEEFLWPEGASSKSSGESEESLSLSLTGWRVFKPPVSGFALPGPILA